MAFQYIGNSTPQQVGSNPFSIAPGNQFGSGLAALGTKLKAVSDDKKEEEAIQRAKDKLEETKQGAIDAFNKYKETGNESYVIDFQLAHPEMVEALDKSLNAYNDVTKQNFKDTLFKIYSDPETAPQYVSERQSVFDQQQVPLARRQETDSFLAKIEGKSPDEIKKIVFDEILWRYPEEAKALSDSKKSKQTVVGKGSRVWDETNQKWLTEAQKEDKYWELSPGEVVKDINGKVIARGNPKETTKSVEEIAKEAYVNRTATPEQTALLKLPKDSKNVTSKYVLPDRSIVYSDDGKNYINESGEKTPLPVESFKLNDSINYDDYNILNEQQKAEETLGKMTEQDNIITEKTMEETAKDATGIYSKLGAAVNGVLGSLGLDRLFGQDGFFPETVQSRQAVRNITQLAKAGLLNSSRGAMWEQQKVENLFPNPDRFFVNPRTEAMKVDELRKILKGEKIYNLEAIANTRDKTEMSKLKASNRSIDEFFRLVGDSPISESEITNNGKMTGRINRANSLIDNGNITPDGMDLINKYKD